ncbi:serine/threonine-protein kinase [Streptomyces sp. NPDC089919]|uniref:serine/threonine-protein kinase n=1 Tax=Streptomyces sp. NPDC089919 TaxID=3155188 RepID=UPI00342C7309
MRPIAAGGPDSDGIGPYRPFAELGAGGMGRVLLAAGPDGRFVAVKQIHAEYADEDGFRARFRREVAASRAVSGACTAPVLDADPDAETPWLASAFVPGPALDQALATTGPLPEEAVRRLAAGLATALADIHRAGLVHRDLKPSNVLLAEDGVRVIDFGIARAVEGGTRITHTGSLIGSPAYMAPEQASGGRVSAATDVFALGSTLVAACTGRPPFAAASVPALLYEVLHAEPDLTGVPAGLRPLIASCLAKDPERRPAPAGILAALGTVEPTARPWPGAVGALAAGQRAEAEALAATLPAVPAVVPAPAPGGRRRWRRTAMATGAVALLAGGALGVRAYLADPPLSEVPDEYRAKAMTCRDVGGEMQVPVGFTGPGGAGIARRDGSWADPNNTCGWASFDSSAGTSATVTVYWGLYEKGGGRGSGAEQADKAQEEVRADGGRSASVGLGEEAAWAKAEEGTACELSVRDVNLRVVVTVTGTRYAAGAECESMAKYFARSGLRIPPKA